MANVEASKKLAASRAVADHFSPDFTYVGIGSGSTVVYVVAAIRDTVGPDSTIRYVPTGSQSRNVITEAGLAPVAFDALPPDTLLDVAFDGADEVDEELNCIKGGGACLYQEKLVATRARKFVCVADYRKRQARLLTQWKAVPVEVEPLAATVVLATLRALGSVDPVIRKTKGDASVPLRTDQNNYIVDAPFPTLLLSKEVDLTTGRGKDGVWEVGALAKKIKAIEGVLSVGIFSGDNGEVSLAKGTGQGGQKPIAVYFGMEDGSVMLRKAGQEDTQL